MSGLLGRFSEGNGAPIEQAQVRLREFVYLDDVSVYSLLASIRGSVPLELTESLRASSSGEFESSLQGGALLAKGGLRGAAAASREKTSHVVSKSTVQAAFKQLYELLAAQLILKEPVGHADDTERVVEPRKLRRGSPLEIEVELEADRLFRINVVIAALLEIVQEDLATFGITDAQGVSQVEVINRVLDRLLSGLVPLRGRVMDWVVIPIGGEEKVVHKSWLTEQDQPGAPAIPLYVVGVADQSLFWKDVRRVLFSQGRYRVFCRIALDGIQASWTPVKLSEVLREVAPDLGAQLRTLGDTNFNVAGSAPN